MRLLGRSVPFRSTLLAMVSGFGLTVLISFFPNAPGDAAERLVPFFIALFIAAAGSTRKPT